MKLRFNLVVRCMLAQTLSYGQQANVNLDYSPQKNTEYLTPFSAPLDSPDVHDDGTVTFRDNLLAEGKVIPMVITIPSNHVGGYGGHDWSTWRHLLYYRFLPNLWRKN